MTTWKLGNNGLVESNEPYVDHMANQIVEIQGIEAAYPELDPTHDQWVTKDGEIIAFKDLTDTHLEKHS